MLAEAVNIYVNRPHRPRASFSRRNSYWIWTLWRLCSHWCSYRGLGGGAPKPVEMRRIGDAAWRYFASRTDAAKAFGVTTNDVGYLLREPSKASRYACEFEARPAPAPKKRERPTYRSVEGAKTKTNGKWRSGLFPGREFDDLDEFRAAKKQREERREDYRAQARDNRCHVH